METFLFKNNSLISFSTIYKIEIHKANLTSLSNWSKILAHSLLIAI